MNFAASALIGCCAFQAVPERSPSFDFHEPVIPWTTPIPFDVRGVVLDEARQPVSGARVSLFRRTRNGAACATVVDSDFEGRFRLEGSVADNAPWRIEARAEGAAVSVLEGIGPQTEPLDVGAMFLFPPVTFRGRVIDREGSGITGATLNAFGGVLPIEAGVLATTSPDGSFEIREIPRVRLMVRVNAPGFDQAIEELDPRDLANNGSTIPLRECRDLEGTVVDERGLPVAGARVGPVFKGSGSSTSCDERGRFRVCRASIGDRASVLAIDCPGFATRWITRATDDSLDRVVLRRAPRIRLRLAREGGGDVPELFCVSVHDSRGHSRCGNSAESEWARLLAESTEISVGDGGEWNIECRWRPTFDAGPPDRVIVTSRDGAQWETTIPASAWDEPSSVEMHAILPRTHEVAGCVVDTIGKPVAGATVELDPSLRGSIEKCPRSTQKSGADGRFTFERVGARRNVLRVLTADWVDLGAAVVDEDANMGRRTARLVVERPPHVRGRVTIDGRPPKSPVLLQLRSGWLDAVTATGAEGTFDLSSVRSRDVRIFAKRPATPRDGAYRAFDREFVEVSASRVSKRDVELAIDLPADFDAR